MQTRTNHERPIPRRTAPRQADQQREGAARAFVAGERRALDPGAILHLQRSAGNERVATALRRPPVVQRGLFDMLGGLLGGGGGLSGLASRGAEAGTQRLAGTIGGPFGQILGGAASGLGGVAGSLAAGNTGAALSGLQSTGAAAAGPLAQTGMGMLGNVLGGPLGSVVGGLGGAVGQGLSSVISGGNVGQALSGVLGAAAPGLKDLASNFLRGI